MCVFSLDISCENEGCSAIVKLDLLARHRIDCEHSPKTFFQCENGCRMNISQADLSVRMFHSDFFIFSSEEFLES